ncbi:MAG: iron ABC transporter permease [Desulfobacterales bacterium]|nr:iron ABC transporter permease [Desulfobacterales bacterium]
MVLLTAGLVALFLGSLMVGRYDIGPKDLFAIFRTRLQGGPLTGDLGTQALIFFQIRLPRCLMALLAGAGLSVSGAAYQALFRNPLVSPDILGVAAGCTFGAALGLVLPGESFALVRALAFVGGLLAVYLAVGIAKWVRGGRPVIILVLAGLVVTSVFNALLMVLKYGADPYNELPAIVFWIMGSLNRVVWADLYIMIPVVGGGMIAFVLLRYRLNVLSLGDLQARSLGMNPGFYRFAMISLSSLMVAICVSTCGQICWIGLVVPHMARTLVGPNHQRMIPVTLVMGALFLLVADAMARSLTAAELPVSIITALSGAPLFAFLLYRNRGRGWI